MPRLFLALGSAALLLVAFPNFNQPWCAWIALVPWLVLLRSCAPRAAFGWSWLIGFLFFLGSIWWLIHVTLVGWIILCVYLASSFAGYGWLIARVGAQSKGRGAREHQHALTPWWFPPALWVTVEYARSHLLTGFGWNLLAYSQTQWRELIQVADVTGVWGVSFLIVLVNVALARLLSPNTMRRKRLAGLIVAVIGVVGVLGYGAWRIPQVMGQDVVRVAVVQGNIPQTVKWDPAFQEEILTRYESLTTLASASRPDLIVWPETSVPGYLGVEEGLTQRLMSLAQDVQRPLLVGSALPVISPALLSLTNSAILIDERGNLRMRYDKLHLVPFGEFIPFERTFPWLRDVLPPIGDFVPGTKPTVFQGDPNTPSLLVARPLPLFSVLICFEDIFPELARRFVQEGARLLLVITNDAWFGPTAAAYQHAQASTFRAIELRVPVVRAANTGWSGCIDPSGRWIGSVKDADQHELFVAGTHTCEVPLGPAKSPYLAWGDWVALLCLGATVGWCLWRKVV